MGDENHAEKIKNIGLTFSAAMFTPLPPIATITGPSMGDENRAKKSKTSVDFFNRNFHHTTTHTLPPYPTAITTGPRIRDIESSNSFGNLLVTISNL